VSGDEQPGELAGAGAELEHGRRLRELGQLEGGRRPARSSALVELQQCTGEPVERLESDDPALIAYLEGVESDLDLVAGGEQEGKRSSRPTAV
jgi:hypothetical protein